MYHVSNCTPHICMRIELRFELTTKDGKLKEN